MTVTMPRQNWTWLLAATVEQLTEQVGEARTKGEPDEDGYVEPDDAEQAAALMSEARDVNDNLLPVLWLAADRENPDFDLVGLMNDWFNYSGFVIPRAKIAHAHLRVKEA